MKSRFLLFSLILFLLILLTLFRMSRDTQTLNEIITKGEENANGIITLAKTVFTIVMLIVSLYFGYSYFQGYKKIKNMVIGFIVLLIIYFYLMIYSV